MWALLSISVSISLLNSCLLVFYARRTNQIISDLMEELQVEESESSEDPQGNIQDILNNRLLEIQRQRYSIQPRSRNNGS
jgi:hypothetical protein